MHTFSCPYYAELINARLRLGQAMSAPPIRIPLSPTTEAIEASRDELCRDFAKLVDDVVKAAGEYLDHHSSRGVDLKLFTDVLSGALEGNAEYEFNSAVESLREDAGWAA